MNEGRSFEDIRTTVLIVDDEPIILRLLHRILEMEEWIQIVGEATSGQHAIDLCANLHPDVVILDHKMPELSGIETARRILAENPAPRVIMFSTLGSDGAWVESVKSFGVSACLTKTDVSQLPDIIAALR